MFGRTAGIVLGVCVFLIAPTFAEAVERDRTITLRLRSVESWWFDDADKDHLEGHRHYYVLTDIESYFLMSYGKSRPNFPTKKVASGSLVRIAYSPSQSLIVRPMLEDDGRSIRLVISRGSEYTPREPLEVSVMANGEVVLHLPDRKVGVRSLSLGLSATVPDPDE